MSTINILGRKEHEDFQHDKLGVHHLGSKHITEFKKYQKAQEEKTKLVEQQTSSSNKQLTLEATKDCVKLWNSCDP